MSRCHDCNAKEGQYHELGCDMETCPFCGGQLISCDCCYKQLGLQDYKKNGKLYDGLTKDVYTNGISQEQGEKWEAILREKGRIPWIEIPNMCRLCGTKYPSMFMDKDWKKYVIPPLQDEELCTSCYEEMKRLFPNGWKKDNKMEITKFDGQSLRCPICNVKMNFYDNEEESINKNGELIGKILKCKNGHLSKEMVK